MGKKISQSLLESDELDLRLLKVFSTVVTQRGIKASEEVLGLSASTISNYIAKLEKSLGTSLCTRGRSGFALTKHGDITFNAYLKLSEAIETFNVSLSSFQDDYIGEINLALADHILSQKESGIVQAIQNFQALAPKVDLNIITQQSGSIFKMVESDHITLGIDASANHHESLYITHLFSESMSVYCGKGHELFELNGQPINSQQLKHYNFVNSVNSDVNKNTYLSESYSRAENLEARAILILTGNYIGYLPDHFVERLEESNNLKKVSSDEMDYINDFYVAYKPKNKYSKEVQLLIKCLVESAIK